MSDDLEYVWVTDAESRIKFQLPSNWLRKPLNDSEAKGFKATSPDNAVALEFVFISKGAEETAAQQKRIMEELDKNLTDVRVTTPATNAMHGQLKVFGIAGVGTNGGRAIQWASLTYGDGQGHGVILTMLILAEKEVEVAPTTQHILKTIGPHTPAAD